MALTSSNYRFFQHFLKLDFLEGYPAKPNSKKFTPSYFTRELTGVFGEAQF